MFGMCKGYQQTESQIESDIENRKSLKYYANDLQNKQKQPQKYVIYDSVQGISYIKQKTIQKQQQAIVNKYDNAQNTKKSKNIITNAKQLFNTIITTCKQNSIKQKILNFSTVLFHALGIQQFRWIQKLYMKYTQNRQQQLNSIPKQHILKMKKIINRIRFQIQSERISHQNRLLALEDVIRLQSFYENIEGQKHRKLIQYILVQQKDYYLLFMISAYQIFKNNYNTYKRRKLKHMFKSLEMQCSGLRNSIQVLRFFQYKDPLLVNQKPLNQLDLNLQVVRIIDQYMKNNNMVQLNTKVSLVKVSSSPYRRRVVNFLISGFLSQDVDKRQQWNQLLACMPNSQVYGLQWQSHTINRLIKFLALSVKDLVLGKDLNQLLTKDNPFVPAFQIAILSGEMLAHLVHKIFPFQFINIISYSLGSQLIRSFLQKSIQLNKAVNINKVIALGGVTDIQQFKKTLQKTNHQIHILNIKTKHDSVLKHILKRAKPNIKPIGLFELDQNINNHLVENMDVSKEIKGHFSFMTNFGTIAELLMLNQQ